MIRASRILILVLVLTAFASARPVFAQPQISYGQTVAGSIETVGEKDEFTFSGTSGDKITLRFTETNGSLDSYVEVFNPSGMRIAYSSAGFINVTLSASGTFRITLEDYNNDETGSYELSLQCLNNPVGAITLNFGQTTAGSIASFTKIITYQFTASANDIVDIRFTKLTDASGYFTPYLELYNSAGVRLAYVSSEALVKKVNATATYYLFVTDYSYDATGTYELTMQRDNNPANSRALNYGAITAGSLINPTGINVYRFTATANGKITICSVVQSETSGNFSPYLELYDTTGTRLKYGSGSLQHTFANSGTFYLFITDYSRNGTGIYKFILSSGTVSCSSIDLENPKVKLTWPKDAEIVENGSTYNITWTSSDNVGITSQEILLSTDSGATYPTVIASSLAGSVQSYAWQIPSDLATSHARIKIIAGDAQGNTGEGTNSNDFIISNTALPVSAESTAYEYDKLQRLKKSNSSAGTSAEYTYDASGNRLKAICK
jgi:hypothetical protein